MAWTLGDTPPLRAGAGGGAQNRIETLLSRDPTAMMKMVDLQYICCTHWAGSGPQLELQRAWPAFSTPGFVMITSERLRTINAEIESCNIDCPFKIGQPKKKIQRPLDHCRQKGRVVCRQATPSGNRTRVSPVAGAYSTTRPTVSEAVSPPSVRCAPCRSEDTYTLYGP